MNVEDRYRTALEHLTESPVGAPDLATSLAAGRRRRRVRRTFVAGGAVAALAVAGVGGAWLQRPHEVVTAIPIASSPSFHDFVPGTQVDENLQATIDQDLPGVPAADKIYPNDWNDDVEPDSPASGHDAGLPDSEALNATAWVAIYNVDPDEDLVVQVSKAVPGWPLKPNCSEIAVSAGQPTCSVTPVAGGGRVASYGFTTEASVTQDHWFLSVYTAPDGSTVNVTERVAADSWPQAEARRAFTVDETATLASDPALTFPDPVVTPPDPKGP